MPIDSKKVHQHLKTIARLNTTLAMLGLVGVITLYVWVWLAY